jgi:hypothetical protein
MSVGIYHADHVAPSSCKKKKLALTLLTSGGRSVGVVLSRTQAAEFSFFRGVVSRTPNPQTGGHPSNHNLRLRHAVVTGTHNKLHCVN